MHSAATSDRWLSFLAFWGLNILVIYKGMEVLKVVENFGGAVRAGDDLAAGLVGDRSRARAWARSWRWAARCTARRSWPVFFPALTAMVGFWATLF